MGRKFEQTLTGALTRRVMTSTKVPPRVHQTLNVLMPPIAFVPTVFIMPDAMFTPNAITAISTRVRMRLWPTSARDARYSATLDGSS